MRDLRNEMYAGTRSDDEEDSYMGGTTKVNMQYVSREEYQRKIKELERKIAMLEARLNSNSDGWGTK